RRLLEHDRDLLTVRRRPPLEHVDEANHRRMPVPPPCVRTRADHVHPVYEPAHREQAYVLADAGRRIAGDARTVSRVESCWSWDPDATRGHTERGHRRGGSQRPPLLCDRDG